MPKREPHDLFYWENHQRHDAELHEPILNDGDDEAARAVSIAVMRRLGFSEVKIRGTVMAYTPQQRQRVQLRAKRALGKVNKSDDDDRQEFMDQCVSDLEDAGVSDPEGTCSLIWEEQGD